MPSRSRLRGRLWLFVGVALGIALGLGHLAYFHGAAVSLSDTALRIVNTAGLTVVHDAAKHGAPRRAVEGLTAVLAVLLPALTSEPAPGSVKAKADRPPSTTGAK